MFRFRLEKVLRYRSRLVDEQTRALGRARQALRRAEQAVAEQEREIRDLARWGERSRRQTADVGHWERQTAWLASRLARLTELRRAVAAAREAVDRQRQALLERQRDKEVLESLAERRRRQWEREQVRRRRKAMDEIGANRAAAARQQEVPARGKSCRSGPGGPEPETD